MKKTSLALTPFFWVPFALHAQITITSADYSQVSSPLTQYTDTSPSITPGSAGANVSWNFAALNAHDTVSSTFMAPAAGVLGSSFSMTNKCMKQDTNYLYLDTSTTKIDFWGIAGNLLGNSVNNALVYSNPQTILTFPSTYTTTFTDAASYDVKFNYNALYKGVFVDSLRQKSSITTTSTMDGWGNVTTPKGTLACLRQNVLKNSIDSTWVKVTVGAFTYWMFLYADNSNTQSYNYLSNVTGGPVVEIEYYADSSAIFEVRWNPTPLIGIAEHTTSDIAVYPNPVSDYLSINSASNENMNAIIYDLAGREVLHAAVSKLKPTIPVANLENGAYLLRVYNKEGLVKSDKITIIH